MPKRGASTDSLAHPAKKHRRSLREIYIHHIIWGFVCLVLFFIIIALWFNSQELSRKTTLLETNIASLGGRASSCQAYHPWQAGTSETFAVTTAGEKRTYAVHLPESFSTTKYYPLVLFYGGMNMSRQSSEKLAGFNDLDVISVYPAPTTGTNGLLAWQSAPYSSDSNDIAFTKQLLGAVEQQLCIDTSRIYATGFSNGGGFASYLSCELPDTFAAIGIDSAALYSPDGNCMPSSSTALISVHGDADTQIPYTGSTSRQLPDIDAWIKKRAQANHCLTTPSVISNLTTITTTWTGCKSGATVQNIHIKSGHHLWDDTTRDTIWQFMSHYSR